MRAGGDPQLLFDSSQMYFTLVNETVFAAEVYSEAQVGRMNRMLISVNVVFLVLLAFSGVLFARGRAVKRQADALGKIAYVDPLTNINNRASCEAVIGELETDPPQNNVAVVVVDMNNLKLTNDALGHQGGDRIIADFAQILNRCMVDGGFVGRFCGDEFLAFFKTGGMELVSTYLQAVEEATTVYNVTKSSPLEQIDYAVGVAVNKLQNSDVQDMIHDADNAMYRDKREKKLKNRAVGGHGENGSPNPS